MASFIRPLIDNLSGPDSVIAHQLESTSPIPVMAVPKYTLADAASTVATSAQTTNSELSNSKYVAPPTGRLSGSRFAGAGGGMAHGTSTTSSSDLSDVFGDPAYYFYGSMSESLIHKYLDRAVEMNAVSVWHRWPGIPCSGSYACSTSAEHDASIKMITDIGAKYVGGMASFWGWWDYLDDGITQLKKDIEKIHSIDPDVICEAKIFEYSDSSINSITLTENVWSAFFNTTYVKRNFKYIDMLYKNPSDSCRYPSSYAIDITQTESQMWYYYLATRFIDAGVEAIHFGDISVINCIDQPSLASPSAPGNGAIWSVVQKVRNYARYNPSTGVPGAQRGMVLCNGGACNNVCISGVTHNSMYYDPDPIFLEPDWNRLLIFDIHWGSIFPLCKIGDSQYCNSVYQPVWLNDEAENWKDFTPCGLHPQGWYCKHNAFLGSTDNGASFDTLGCISPETSWNPFYGWDPSSWFASQSEYDRDRIIPYFYFGFKCCSLFTHYYMPGRLLTSLAKTSLGIIASGYYRANDPSPDGGQESVINDTWNSLPTTPLGLIHHNFSLENVVNLDFDPVYPVSDLIFVGDTQMYFIANDGLIHGFIRSGDYNSGSWLTVSPSWSADGAFGQVVSSQVRAKSNLVASPNGNMLLYIGVDGYIHGFEVIDIWTYFYIYSFEDGNIRHPHIADGTVYNGFMVKPMMDQNIKAINSLIFPIDDRIFYIGQYIDGSQYVHCFQKSSGFWQTVSPSYAAGDVESQLQAAGALTYDSSSIPNRLYYRSRSQNGIFPSTEGYLAYFEVNSLIDYTYIYCPANYDLINQNLKITGNLSVYHDVTTSETRIYYVGNFSGDNSYFIHYVQQNYDGSWNTGSPSYSADIYNGQPISSQIQSDIHGTIVVDPSGTNILYFGKAPYPFICYYYKFGDILYSFNILSTSELVYSGSNSLQFTNEGNIFYISSDRFIHHYRWEKLFCQNPAVKNFT